VVIEAVSSEKKVVNPSGVAFLTTAETANPAAALMQLQNSLKGASINAADVLRVTCFMTSLDDLQTSRSAVAGAFPSAAANFVQMQRLGLEPQVLCEAVARLAAAPSQPLVLGNGVALVNVPKLVLTSTQLVFRDQDSDFRLAYQRLSKTLAAQGAAFKDAFWTGTYVLTRPNAAKLETIQWEFLDRAHPPTHLGLQIEGLPSTDATAAIEVMALGH
jgi:enamine deaminase RidA (YjgF/YER057c/UK114 family)